MNKRKARILNKLLANVENELKNINHANQIGRLRLEKTRAMCKIALAIDAQTRDEWNFEFLRLDNELEKLISEQRKVERQLRNEAYSLNFPKVDKKKKYS